jgi:hypothetical protein
MAGNLTPGWQRVEVWVKMAGRKDLLFNPRLQSGECPAVGDKTVETVETL